MRITRKVAMLCLGLICIALGFAGRALGEPAKESKTASVRRASPARAATSTKPSPTNPPEGAELNARELKALMDTIFENYRKAGTVQGTDEQETEIANDTKVQQQEERTGSVVARTVEATRGLVNRALSWAGIRYRWGGVSRSGVDCSGLTRLLYLQEGVRLPHNAREQFKVGTPVKREDLLPGDLVFFNTRGPLTHVGMYVGNDKFIHAANRRRGVRVDALSTPYYANRYAGARRYKDYAAQAATWSSR